MESIEDTVSDSVDNSDIGAVHQLMCSVGHLKFSLRNIASMQLQTALHSQKDTEPAAHLGPLESNRVLENIINEVLSHKSAQNDESLAASKVDENLTVEDLELIKKKLQEEFENRRRKFISNMSSRLKE